MPYGIECQKMMSERMPARWIVRIDDAAANARKNIRIAAKCLGAR